MRLYRPWDPHSLLYNGYRFSLPGVKRPGNGVNCPTLSSADVKERLEQYLWAFMACLEGELNLLHTNSNNFRKQAKPPVSWLVAPYRLVKSYVISDDSEWGIRISSLHVIHIPTLKSNSAVCNLSKCQVIVKQTHNWRQHSSSYEAASSSGKQGMIENPTESKTLYAIRHFIQTYSGLS
jgi:hypothetical protein